MEFCLFCDAFPKEMMNGESFKFVLSRPVIVNRWRMSPPLSCASVEFDPGSEHMDLVSDEGSRHDADSINLSFPDAMGVVHLLQMLPDLPRILSELEVAIDGALLEVRGSRSKLESDFGRDLLISEV